MPSSLTKANHQSRRRVLIVGLDGGTFHVIRPLIAQGRLPNLAALIEEGAWGELTSTMPSITPVAWTSFATGKNPGRHGLFDFQTIDPQTYEPKTVRGYRHGQKTLWKLLTEAGLSSIVLDVPFTHPPEPIKGLMVSGYGTPRTPGTVFTHPPELAAELKARYGDFGVALPGVRFDRSEEFFAEWDAIIASRERVAVDLISERDWDLFMVVMSVTDNLAHALWTYYDPAHRNYYDKDGPRFRQVFEGCYEACDRLLGRLVEQAPEADLIVMSDHGFGTGRPRQYLVNALARGGFVQYKGTGGGRLVRWAASLYLRLPWLRGLVKNLRPERRKQLKRELKDRHLMPGLGNIDPIHSQVIPANPGLQMYINRSDRFSAGLVGPDEVEKVCQRVTGYLLSLRDKVSGGPVIRSVYRADEVYTGPKVGNAPDLVIEYTNMYDSQASEPRLNPSLEGRHEQQGILLARGPHIERSQVEGARIEDLAPTVLHLLGQPVPEDMDGRVLIEALEPGLLAKNPVKPGPPAVESHTAEGDYSSEELAEVEEQLRSLGYIE
jgi:predicted AlkP superfamily phosphohydrolase/phosphomutase